MLKLCMIFVRYWPASNWSRTTDPSSPQNSFNGLLNNGGFIIAPPRHFTAQQWPGRSSMQWRWQKPLCHEPREQERTCIKPYGIIVTRYALQLVYLLPRSSWIDQYIYSNNNSEPVSTGHRWMRHLMIPEPNTRRLPRPHTTNSETPILPLPVGAPVLFTEWRGVRELWSHERITIVLTATDHTL